VTAPLAAVPGPRAPYVLGLVRGCCGESEVVYQRDRWMAVRCLACGSVDLRALHVVADELRAYSGASA
jgi:hypothetical protein